MTVEASQALVPALVRLMGELGSVYDLWLTLAPLVRDEAALALAPVTRRSGARGPGRAAARADACPNRHSLTECAAALWDACRDPAGPAQAPADNHAHAGAGRDRQTRADGGPQRAEGPGMDYPILGMSVAGERLEPVGRDESKQWLQVCS